MLNLEVTQIEEQKDELRKDNATLLQRWIDRMNSEVDKMNVANDLYEDMRTRWHSQAANPTNGGPSGTQVSGMRTPSVDSLASTGSLVSSPGKGSSPYPAGATKPKAGGLLLSPNG